MKKLIIGALATVIVLTFVLSAFAAPAGPGDDFQAIKKAVKENPKAVSTRHPRTFRVQVTDIRSGKLDVDIAMPLAVFDIVSRCVDKESLTIHDHGCHVNLGELLNEIQSLGPTMVLELTSHDGIVKVWLE